MTRQDTDSRTLHIPQGCALAGPGCHSRPTLNLSLGDLYNFAIIKACISWAPKISYIRGFRHHSKLAQKLFYFRYWKIYINISHILSRH